MPHPHLACVSQADKNPDTLTLGLDIHMQESGVQLSPDGDGTVPLLSLGALCAGGWKTRRLNPGGSDVIVREYPNNPVPVFKDSRCVDMLVQIIL